MLFVLNAAERSGGGDRLIARGELTELEGDNAGQLAVRLTEVANLRGGL